MIEMQSDNPVRKELADAINKMRELLTQEYGYDFAYSIYAEGRMLAASTQRYGVVHPKPKEE